MKSLISHLVYAILAVTILPITICAENEYAWRSATFPNIDIDTQDPDGPINSQSSVRNGSAMLILDVSGFDADAVLTADNSAAAQLHSATDTLITEYKVTFDGDGVNGTGGTSMENYVPYNDFLSGGGLNIQYKEGDTEVEVTLHVQASNRNDNVADSGIYTATQTLTITWDGL
ncbi:MAG: hypothetical protein A2Y10_14560 [Planctomycetes bacterium GWF2_41_51]|nr:MAG: hypothetical protein A2Y10_14560 [Planctomycetes bacterium GWF2_41_51]HBG25499.1 hypothetical protein [Phycisphaerales bacterium]